jgi:hypothetical protein
VGGEGGVMNENGTEVVVRLRRVPGSNKRKLVVTATREEPSSAADLEIIVRAVSVVLRRKMYPHMDPDRTMSLVEDDDGAE